MIESLISFYGLEPHPEGGYYRETYRSDELQRFDGFEGTRHVSTAIYFLLTQGKKSHFHRIRSDEMWHFYLGDPLEIVEILPCGKLTQTRLGPNFREGHSLQYVVRAGHWFGARSLGEYSFVGCTVAPGFDFADFELAERGELSKRYPQHQAIVADLTP